jgi:hypothetical protein
VKSAIPDRDPRYAGAPVSLRYKGTGWDPEGGPIDVRWSGGPAPTAIYPAFEEPPYGSWDGQSERTFPAADTFTADVFGTQWPDRSTINQRPPYSCSGLLTVTQDDEVVDITRLIRPVGHVVYAYRSPLHTDDVFCPNEISAGLDGRADSQIPGFLVVYSHPAIAAFDDKKFITGGVIAAKDASGKSKRRVMCLEGYAEKKRLQVFFDNTRGDGRVHLDAKLDNGACS